MNSPTTLLPTDTTASIELREDCDPLDKRVAPKSLLEMRGGHLDSKKAGNMVCALSLSNHCLRACIDGTYGGIIDNRVDKFFEDNKALNQGEESAAELIKDRLRRRCGTVIGHDSVRQQLARDKRTYDYLVLLTMKRHLEERKSAA